MAEILLPIQFDDLLALIDQLTPEQKALIKARLAEPRPEAPSDNADEYYSLENVNHRLYERARRYWREHSDPRGDLTDEDLDEQFWFFDVDGVPRLKSDPVDPTPPRGSLAYFSKIVEARGYKSGETSTARRSREILETEFTDHLLRYRENHDSS
jgi:hypothetical protein